MALMSFHHFDTLLSMLSMLKHLIDLIWFDLHNAILRFSDIRQTLCNRFNTIVSILTSPRHSFPVFSWRNKHQYMVTWILRLHYIFIFSHYKVTNQSLFTYLPLHTRSFISNKLFRHIVSSRLSLFIKSISHRTEFDADLSTYSSIYIAGAFIPNIQ